MGNEKKITLFSKANRLRYACEFDKASGVYAISSAALFELEKDLALTISQCDKAIEAKELCARVQQLALMRLKKSNPFSIIKP